MTALIELITADGTAHDLDALCVRGVDDPSGMFVVPAKRGNNLVIPGSHGELHLAGKRYGASNLVLKVWVRGVNADGTIPADGTASRLVFHDNLRTLLGLFTVDEQVTLRHTLSDGTAREITGEVLDAIEPDISDPHGTGRYALGRFAVALACPRPFWTDLDSVTATVSSALSSVTLTEFAGTTAQIEDLMIVFGPQSNPRLEQTSTGVWVAVDRVITSGQTVVIETGPLDDLPGWRVYGTGGVAAGLYEDMRYGGPGTARWFALKPEPGGGAPVVSLTETGIGSGSVSITGKRTYTTT